MAQHSSLWRAAGAALFGAVLVTGTLAFAQGMGHGGPGMGGGHKMHGQGAGRHMHDEATMPGLRGLDATDAESAELAVMFRNFTAITRTVERLPDGIRTVTGSDDPDVFAALVSHVTGMIGRVEDGRDPQVFIQSPTLDIFFERGGDIETDIEVTEDAIIVTQTSTDPALIAALQTHADEVTDMADRGMAAVHERMMGQ